MISPQYSGAHTDSQFPTLKESLAIPILFLSIVWGEHILEFLLNFDLSNWGIYPREKFGLRGILFAPLLHGSWSHLTSNSIPFLVLGTLLFYFYRSSAAVVITTLYFATGFFVWLFARGDVFHIGLSYVVYGLAFYLFWSGVFRKTVRRRIISLFILIFYGGILSGLLPTREMMQMNVSWESHLIGAFVGLFLAYFLKEDLEPDEIEETDIPPETHEHFLPRDVFEKTLVQRAEEHAERERLAHEAVLNTTSTQSFSEWFRNNTQL